MDKAFLLQLSDTEVAVLNNLRPSRDNRVILESLEKHTCKSIVKNGTELENEWFPQVDADIFISHSHLDKDLATSLSSFIEEENIGKCFIDSIVWGYSDNLLDKIDTSYNKERNTINVKEHDKSISHVHNMLSIALAKMIQRCKYFVFLDTDNSRNNMLNMTESPWLYYELSISNILSAKADRLNEGISTFSEIAYKAPTKHLKSVTFEQLRKEIANNRLFEKELSRMRELMK